MRQLGVPPVGTIKGTSGEYAKAALESLELSLVEALGELERLSLNSSKGSKGADLLLNVSDLTLNKQACGLCTHWSGMLS